MKRTLLIASLLVLCTTGCDQKTSMNDLQKFVKETEAKATRKASKMPELKLIKNVHYTASKMKNPFIPLAAAHAKKAKSDNPLQNYHLKELKMVGVLARDNHYWAAIMLPNGHVLEVGVGARIGRNKALVKVITPKYIVLNERLHDTQGNHVKEWHMNINGSNQ